MSFVAELSRRKVFKVGAAYLVVAWLAVGRDDFECGVAPQGR